MMKEHLSIKEFSKFTGISATTLRYWDNIGLFSPIERGGRNNYRYYSYQQIVMVNFIAVLTELEIPIKTIQKIADDKSPESIINLLNGHEWNLDKKLRQLQEMYSIIHTRAELIRTGIGVDTTKISVINMPEKSLIIGPPNNFEPNGDFYEPFNVFYDHAEQYKINLKFPIGGMHNSVEAFFDKPGEPENFFSFDPSGNTEKPAGKYLVGYSKGYYGEVTELATRMREYADENNLKLAGATYTVYLHDEICIKDPSNYLAQVCIPVAD